MTKLKAYTLALATAAAIAMAGGISASAEEICTNNAVLQEEAPTGKDAKKSDRLEQRKEDLAQKLADGTITQEQYDEKIQAIGTGRTSSAKKGKALTEEEKAAKEQQKSDRLEQRKENLAQKLADGTITQEQYDEKIQKLENGGSRKGKKNVA